MEIELGERYRMIKFPETTQAKDYCEKNGFYLGCVCKPIKFTRYTTTDIWGERKPISIDVRGDDMYMNCGVDFFKEYFKIDYRTINLNKLGI